MDLNCLLASACFTGGRFKITENMAAMARWFAKASLSNTRFWSVPFSIACKMKRWVLLTGVMIWIGRRFKTMVFVGQFLAQTPQPRQISLLMTGRFLWVVSSSFMVIASTGHTFSHFPQPTQPSSPISGM